MTKEKLNKKAFDLRNLADSMIPFIDPYFKDLNPLLRKLCIVKYMQTVAKYNSLYYYNSYDYESLVSYVSTLKEIVNDLKDLLEKSYPNNTIEFVKVNIQVMHQKKLKSLK